MIDAARKTINHSIGAVGLYEGDLESFVRNRIATRLGRHRKLWIFSVKHLSKTSLNRC